MVGMMLKEEMFLVPATGVYASARDLESAVYCGKKHNGYCRTYDADVEPEYAAIAEQLDGIDESTLVRIRVRLAHRVQARLEHRLQIGSSVYGICRTTRHAESMWRCCSRHLI